MVKMNFKDPILEKIVRRWKWTRNNTILLFEKAQEEKILNYASKTDKNVSYSFQPILFQFQCIVTTTDTYNRKLILAENQNYGVLVVGGKAIEKKDLTEGLIKKQLEEQMETLEELFKTYSYEDVEENIKQILTISDHEYLHQGEMIVMFREAGVDLPERFKTAWAL
jgi:hypothetical protein